MGRTTIRAEQVDENTLEDDDGDTKVQVEESTDEDKIRFDTAGSERMVITEAGAVEIAGNLYVKDTAGLYTDKIRRYSDSDNTTKILLNDELIKLYGGHSTKNIVAIGENNSVGVDNNFFVSGSVGSHGTSTRGTAVFGGDLFSSGTFYSMYGMRVDTSAEIHVLNIDPTLDTVSFFKEGTPGSDVNWFVSGAIGGTINHAAFGGDLVVSGNLGIGTPDPQTTLHVKGDPGQFRVEDTTVDYAYTIDCDGAQVVTHFGDLTDGESGKDSFMSFGAYGGINRLDTSVRDFHLYGTTTTTGFYFDESAGMFGIGTDSPHSTMHASGSFAGAFTAFSSVTYTAGASHFILDYQGASNTDSVLTLPTPVGIAGRIYHILNNSAAGGTLKVETPAGAFLGANLENDSSDEVELEGDDSSRQMQSIMVCSTGANWFILHDGRRSEYDEHGP